MLGGSVLTDRFVRAVALAIEVHGAQRRKGTDVTYVSHLLGVSGLVLEHGGDEDLAIAALLHDAVEDVQGGDGAGMAARIREEFGDRVAHVVLGCSDTDVQPKPPWRQRKEDYLAHLGEADRDVLLVSCCDKLHNARTTVIELHEHGPDFWLGGRQGHRFNAGPVEQVWYQRRLVEVFTPRLGGDPVLQPLLAEFARTVAAIEQLAVPPG